MAFIKISTKIDPAVWDELRALSKESHQSLSGLLNEAVVEYLRRRRVRPEVLNHLEASMNENEALGMLLAE